MEIPLQVVFTVSSNEHHMSQVAQLIECVGDLKKNICILAYPTLVFLEEDVVR